jgi:hypothetical protein
MRSSREKALVVSLFCLVLLATVILLPPRLTAADGSPPWSGFTVYLDWNVGSDANTGLSPDFPVKTINKAGQIVSAAAQPTRARVIVTNWP